MAFTFPHLHNWDRTAVTANAQRDLGAQEENGFFLAYSIPRAKASIQDPFPPQGYSGSASLGEEVSMLLPASVTLRSNLTLEEPAMTA